MKLTQTRTGKIAVVRQTRNGSYERIGTLDTKLTLKEAKARYHARLEDMERFYNSTPNARYELQEAVRRYNRDVVSQETENA